MNESSFFVEREKSWVRLHDLTRKAESSLKSLSDTELEEFLDSYRRTAADLALVQAQSANQDLQRFLNSLTRRAYGVLYRAPRKSLVQILRLALVVAPQTFRRRVWEITASLAVFLFGVFLPYATIMANPAMTPYFIDKNDRNVQYWVGDETSERSASESVAMTAFYSSNNPRAAVIAGTLAASTFGVGTAWILVINGMNLGALASQMAEVGKLDKLAAWIAPHGATELTAAIISGGAGFCLGWALIAPGRKSRGEALRSAGKDAFVLLMLSFAMMLIAAPFEGFFSFNPYVPNALKLAVGALVFAGWMLYFFGYGKQHDLVQASS